MNSTMTMPTQTRRRKPEKRLGPLHEPAAFVDGPNQYQYVGGDPVGAVDPGGMATTQPTTRPSTGPTYRQIGEGAESKGFVYVVDETGVADSSSRTAHWRDAMNNFGRLRASRVQDENGWSDFAQLERYRGQVFTLALMSRLGMHDASRGLQHYVELSGAAVQFDLAKGVRSDAFSEAARGHLWTAQRFAALNVQSLKCGRRFHLARELGGSAGDRGRNYSVFIGAYWIWSEARVLEQAADGYITMEWTLHVEDIYDYHSDKKYGLLKDRDLADLAAFGGARPYQVHGAAKVTVVWNPSIPGSESAARKAAIGTMTNVVPPTW